MNKKTNYQLTKEEQEQLETAISYDQRAEVVQRATAIRMLHLGYKPRQVAEVMVVQRSSISNWWRRWEAGGVDALANRPKSGRPEKGSGAYWKTLEESLNTDPTSLGYPFTVWRVERLRDHLTEQTGIHLSGEQLRLGMRKRGYVWRRPKHTLTTSQNQEHQQQAEVFLQELKKEPQTAASNYSIWTKRA